MLTLQLSFLNFIRHVMIFLSLFFIAIPIHAQNTLQIPIVLNNGGNYTSAMEWSIGESVSITSFINSNYKLNTGFLQLKKFPSSFILKNGPDNGKFVFGNQIQIGPNPTYNKFRLKSMIGESGNLIFNLLDSKNTILEIRSSTNIKGIYENSFSLESYPSGIYFLNIHFIPTTGDNKIGSYKIIKL